MKTKDKLTGAAAGALLLLVLAVLSGFFSNERDDKSPGGRTVTATRGFVTPTLAVTGFVVSPSERVVFSKASGEVKSVTARVGSRVKKGQTLVVLGKVEAERELEVAQASYNSALARLIDLTDASASDAQIADQRAAFKRAKADKESAEAAVADTVIRSPISGTILKVNAYVGDRVAAGSTGSGTSGQVDAGAQGLITIADLRHLQIEAMIDQSDIAKVSVGQNVRVGLDAVPDRKFQGKVVRIDPVPQVAKNVVTYSVYVSFARQDQGVRLGMSADLDIDLGAKKSAITVPSASTISRNGQGFLTGLLPRYLAVSRRANVCLSGTCLAQAQERPA